MACLDIFTSLGTINACVLKIYHFSVRHLTSLLISVFFCKICMLYEKLLNSTGLFVDLSTVFVV